MRDPIDAMIAARRHAAAEVLAATRGANAAADSPRWGLALSGGGIRSATFCLGLLKALAEKRTLLRFDLISTVSGGGYVGAMLGRLLGRCVGAREAAAVLDGFAAREPPWFLWWLRANGRYLIPAGAKDSVFAFALYARNTVAVHIELGLFGLLLGAFVSSLDLAGWWLRARFGTEGMAEAALRWLAPQHDAALFLPVPAFALPLLLVAAAVCACAYWGARLIQRSPLKAFAMWLAWMGALAIASAVAWLQFAGAEVPAPHALLRWAAGLPGAATLHSAASAEPLMRALFLGFGIVVSAAWILGVPLAAGVLLLRRARDAAGESTDERLVAARNALTRALASVLRVALAVLGLAALDRLAWAMAFELESLVRAGVALAALAIAVRTLAPLAAMLKPGAFAAGTLLRLANLLGLCVAFLLLAWWVSLVQRAALGAVFGREGIGFEAGFGFVAVIALPVLVYVLLTRDNMDFLNVSSLQTFYRSRLVRAYLGAVNPARYPHGGRALRPGLEPANPLPAEPAGGYAVRQVSDVDADDDIAMHDYAAHAVGAPVHLMTACINQTDDPRGRFNRDRRGVPLTVAPGGWFRVALQPWQQVARERALTLGNWMSISGGAFSPGLGANTRAGVAALATFAGVRLGYWWDGLRAAGVRSSAWFPKLGGLLDEARGRFPGTRSQYAFLSDGGHAENTGVWPLLVQRCGLIVLADCGADPSFRFEDLENLVRRARIDLSTRIRFLTPKALPLAAPFQRFGTLDELASPASQACIAIARIDYPEPGARPGHLMLVKPNIWPELPPDVANYHAANPSFPQQTTLDQFFDEAQWESYYALGCALGNEVFGALDAHGASGLAAAIDALFERDRRPTARAMARRRDEERRELGQSFGAALLSLFGRRPAPAATAPAADAPPASGRVASRLTASAVNASIGLGAAATVAVSAWQSVDAYRSSHEAGVKEERAALKEMADLWARVPAPEWAAVPAGGTAAGPGPSIASAASSASAASAASAAPAAPSAPALASPASAPPSPAWARYVEATSALAGTIARDADSLCPAGAAGWFARSPLAVRILDDTTEACTQIGRRQVAPAACRALLEATRSDVPNPTCLRPQDSAVACPPRYWGYDYRPYAEAARCVPEAAAARASAKPAPMPVVAGAAPTVASAVTPAPLPAPAAPASASAAVATATASLALRTGSGSGAEACAAEPGLPCCGTTVYVQVYGSGDRERARGWRARLRATGASVPPVDDVVASARAANRPQPGSVDAPSVRYADPAVAACAAAAIIAIDPQAPPGRWRTTAFAEPDPGRRGQLEVWLPPGFAPARAAGGAAAK